MYVSFNELPADSRIWIYQANRDLTEQEVAEAAIALRQFCESWTAHQQHLKTSFSIVHNRFVVLASDEDYHLPSGCSIDSSVRALKQMQQQLGLDLFDRTNIAFFVEGRVQSYPMLKLKALFESGVLSRKTLAFDNLVPSKGDLASRWTVEAEKTWLAKYLPDSALAS